MAYPKLKTESYTNLGGMNTKASQYLTGPMEFLNLLNVDTSTPGSLSSFSGSTAFTTASATSPITGIFDYYAGFVGTQPTYSLTGLSAAVIASTRYSLCNATGTTFLSVYDFLYAPNSIPVAFAKGSRAYAANGLDFVGYDGFTTTWQYGLPKPSIGTPSNRFYGTGGLSGTLVFYYSAVRKDGLVGPFTAYTLTVSGYTGVDVTPPSINLNFGSGLSAGSWGLSGLRAWVSLNGNAIVGYTPLIGYSGTAQSLSLGQSYTGNGWALTTPQPDDYQGTFAFGAGATQGSDGNPYNGAFGQPSLLEIYANQLFMAGAKVFPNRIYYSRIGEFEKTDYENFFDVVTPDGDVVSALKAYFTELVIWKTGSTWVLNGSGPGTFQLTQVSPIYGCLSSRASCVWRQQLWFLDKQGICEFNGANTQIVSNNVQPVFDRMNLQAARTEAIMLHVKERNEVWCAIPVDGSATNNMLVVYNYLTGAWYTRATPDAITAMAVIGGGLGRPAVYTGSASGAISSWGASLLTDNGSAFTCTIKSRFFGDMGFSVEKMFRRLYLDATVPAGTTQVVRVNLYADQGASPAYSTTMALGTFQNRIDFGVSAKSLAIEIIYNGGQPFKLNGFTIEHRFQRAV